MITSFSQEKLQEIDAASDETTQNGETHPQENQSLLYTLLDINHGLIQSPINMITSQTREGRHKIIVNEFDCKAREVVNTGHTVQLNFEEGSTLSYDGKTFHFLQCHFHTPSEHQLDGMTFPMEAHFVHTRQDPNHPEATEYLVIGALFKMGIQNEFLNKFLNQIPKTAHASHQLDTVPVKFNDLIKEMEMNHYYAYRGSLTTPPYTETVNWLVLKAVFQASPEQIQTMNELEGDNARHVQAAHGRTMEVH